MGNNNKYLMARLNRAMDYFAPANQFLAADVWAMERRAKGDESISDDELEQIVEDMERINEVLRSLIRNSKEQS